MAALSDAAIVKYAVGGGFTGNAVVTATAIALAESNGDPQAKHVNTDGSIDRGLWQINNRAHPDVTDTCAYNPSCCASSAFRIARNGTSFTAWTTYNSGAYRSYTARALAAASNAGALSGPGSPPPPPPNQGSTIGGTPLSYQTVTLSNVLGGSTKPDYMKLGTSNDALSAYRTILAIGLMFLVLFAIAKTRVGYTAIYYGEALILFFLVVTQAQFFKEALSPLTTMTQPTTS